MKTVLVVILVLIFSVVAIASSINSSDINIRRSGNSVYISVYNNLLETLGGEITGQHGVVRFSVGGKSWSNEMGPFSTPVHVSLWGTVTGGHWDRDVN